MGFLCLICQISIGRLLGNKLKLNLHITLLFYLSNRKMFNKIWFHDLWCFCLKYNLVMLYFCSSFSAYNIHDDKMPQWRAPSSIFCHVRTNFCKAFNALKNDIREQCGQNWLQKVASFRTFVSRVCSYLRKNFSLSSYIVTKNVCSFSTAEVRNKGFIHSMGRIIWGYLQYLFVWCQG